MATKQVLVVPPYRGRGMIGLSLAVGSVGGLLLILFERLPGPLSVMLLLAGSIAWPVIFACALVRVTQRISRTASLSAAFWVGFGGTALLPMLTSTAVSAKGHSTVEWVEAGLIVITALGVMGGAFGLFALWITRVAFFKSIEQDGNRCWKCGDSKPATVCQRCGEPPHVGQWPLQRLHWVIRFGRRCGWPVFIAMFGLALAIRPVTAPGADSTDDERLATLGPLVGTSACVPGTNYLTPSRPCSGARIPLDPSNRIFLLVTYNPRHPARESIMQLQVARVSLPRSGPLGSEIIQVELGAPRVLCDLDDAQSQVVFRSGVPQTLKDAMLAASVNVSWNGWPGAPPTDIRIDPAVHFPKAPAP